MSMIAKNRIHSAWTPLSNEETNNQVSLKIGESNLVLDLCINKSSNGIFEERASLVMKWFHKWNDDQRKKMFEELVGISKSKQLGYARELIDSRVPCPKDDFTRFLPRVISLYILSYLDARSLCKCAQVCWYWRYLTELDQLWMPKCLHFGWYLAFTPSPYENGVWKRNFIEQFKIIQAILPKNPPVTEMKKLKLDGKYSEKSGKGKKSGPAPWRGSDPVPKDTWRFNYLNNDEVLEHVAKLRQRKIYGVSTDDIVKNARSKVNTGSNILNTLTRSKSLTRLSTSAVESGRPKWARQGTRSSQFMHQGAMKENGVLARITRPGPASPPPRSPHKNSSRPATARTLRDPPTTELFPQMPWKIPDHAESEGDLKY